MVRFVRSWVKDFFLELDQRSLVQNLNAVVYNQRVEDDSLVISKDGGIEIIKRKKPECQAQLFFRDKIN